jgi:phosphatidylglycerol:prolipoprotein diacylglycerol transferase
VRTTLFYLPAEFAGWPVFGFGWALFAWIAVGAIAGLILWQRPSARRELPGYLPVFLLISAVIAFVLPTLVEAGPSGKPIGLPIRGYGVMMMLGTVCGVGLAAYRAWQVGIDPESIYSLAIAMFLAGIVGARLFYVIEYWNQEFAPQRTGGVQATIQAIVNVPKGGLVVYGSVLFGVPAGIWFCQRRGLSAFKIGDVIAPSMVVGLALGRLGCFLNGCCFGGVCLTHSYALTFPADSPPYLQHEKYGWRSGVWLDYDEERNAVVVAYIAPNTAAAAIGLRPGDEIVRINGASFATLAEAREKLAAGHQAFELETPNQIIRWTNAKPPPRSVPIHATQLYAAIDAALLAALLWLYFPFRRRDGEVFAILLTIHPISRFLIEMIRSDEPKYPLTISQWISIALLIAGIGLWIAIERGPRRSTTAAAAG